MQLPKEIPAKSDMQHKLVWELVDRLLDTGEPKEDKEEAEYMAPHRMHLIPCLNSMSQQKADKRFIVYVLKG